MLADGVPYEVGHLQDRHERIDWSAYVRFMANAGRTWSDAELVAIGGSMFESPFFLPLKVMARVLFTAPEFFRWVNSKTGAEYFTCIEPSIRELGERRFENELRLREGYAPCREFFVVCKGGLAAFPTVQALPRAVVEMRLTERGAVYDITFPRGGGALGRLRRLLAWPFTTRAVARELADAHTQLLNRYAELDAARGVLAAQALQLRTAQSITQVIHRELDLDRTMAAVAEALVEVGGFVAARVAIAVEIDGRALDRTAAAGDAPDRDAAIELPLIGRGERRIGRLTLWPAAAADRAERLMLLDHVKPAIAMTLDDALSFTALSDYRQHLEERVAERTADLGAARDALAETLDRLQGAQRSRDKIFANINHEIRTPLSLITLAVSDLRRRSGERLDAGGRQDLATIGASARRLLRLVDDLLLLAASEEGKLALAPDRCDVAAVLGGVVATFRPAAIGAQLELVYRGPPSAVAIVDELAIERIAANLVSNAIKFTPPGGRVEVRLADHGDRLELAVRDTGIGIDDEFRARIFGRFEQGRPAVVRGGRGSGLGLALVRELAHAHGGTIGVESPRGGGSVFRLALPRRAEPAIGTGEPPASASPPRAARSSAAPRPADYGLAAAPSAVHAIVEAQGPGETGGTILVAEDDVELAAALGRLLSRHYRVLLASDGMSALRLAERHLPDALVTDLGMPGMDGLELARRFRELPHVRLAPVLILTAFNQIADRLAGFEAGAVDYVAKPFEPDELLARLRGQLAIRDLALKLHRSEQLAALGTLSAGLAHEIRNPVNAIVNAIEPLKRKLPADAIAPGTAGGQLLEVVERCAAEVAALARQLLGFSRPDAALRAPVAFGALVDRALVLVGGALAGRELRRELGYDGEVRCAGPLVVQLLTNLLGNAAHAAGPGGWVRIASRVSGGRLIVEIDDSGPGVAAALRDKVFEPFFTTKPPGVGSGLGLYTSRRIAAMHDGSLEVGPDGPASRFRLELPVGAVLVDADRVAGGAGGTAS